MSASAGPAAGSASAPSLARTAELVGAGLFAEAEAEVLRVVARAPGDARALNVLALVRVKRGHLTQAREAFRSAVSLDPSDGPARRGLALVALKLGWWDEAARELGALVERAADDAQGWTFLGYAHARAGRAAEAARAFRRAGQHALADTVEAPNVAPSMAGDGGAVARRGGQAIDTGALRVPLAASAGPAHVRESVLLAVTGSVAIDLAHGPAHGRRRDGAASTLGTDADPFVCLRGDGEVQLGLPHGSGRLAEITVAAERVFLAEERVMAFAGDLDWSAGRVPRDRLPLVALAGTGVAVVLVDGAGLLALPVSEAAPVAVARTRLVGWRGAIVPRPSHRAEGGHPPIVFEGDGVVLLSRTPLRAA